MKVVVYIGTSVIHWLIAYLWCTNTGLIGGLLMFGHWFIFKGCFINHLERIVHMKILGCSYIPDNYRETRFYRWVSLLKRKQ